jgi:hypothetical protein
MKGKLHLSMEQELSEYLHSDYLTEAEKDAEADIPVPDRLLPKWKYQSLVRSLRLSQKIGLLIWLNRENLLSIGGRERLLYLQSKSSFEALEAGLQFAQRLSKESKLLSDFKHHMRELNRRPQSKRFRQAEVRRIGVGYRDKGMLPEQSIKARQLAQRESFISSADVPERVIAILQKYLPNCLTEDGEFVDLSEFSQDLRVLSEFSEMTELLHPL